MPPLETTGLDQEWITSQNQYEQYERSGLLIKLVAILLCALGFVLALHEIMMALLLLVLWLQEGIFRTSQTRLGMRILHIEQALSRPEAHQVAAFQLHSEWQAARPGTFGLLVEYGANAIRPTVAFPYAVLLLLIGLLVVLSGR